MQLKYLNIFYSFILSIYMIDFKNIEYLRFGNKKQKEVYTILVNNSIISIFKNFTHLFTRTIPINIYIETII